jgi:hypothetical protein
LVIIEQQFRAEKTLLSDRIDNELLFINLATVPAERILFPHLLQAVKRYRQLGQALADISKNDFLTETI